MFLFCWFIVAEGAIAPAATYTAVSNTASTDNVMYTSGTVAAYSCNFDVYMNVYTKAAITVSGINVLWAIMGQNTRTVRVPVSTVFQNEYMMQIRGATCTNNDIIYAYSDFNSNTAVGTIYIEINYRPYVALPVNVVASLNTALPTTSVPITTSSQLDVNLKQVGGDAVIEAGGILSTMTVSLPAITLSSSTPLSAAIPAGVVSSLASTLTGAVLNALGGSAGQIYPNPNTVLPFSNQYHTPIYGNVMPQSAYFHACVNGTGNYNTGALFTAPNGTCIFHATVSISSSSTSASSITVGGLLLNNNTVISATVVGSGANTNHNDFFDTCSAQQNYIFLNTTAPSGTQCMDISLTLASGTLPTFVGFQATALSCDSGDVAHTTYACRGTLTGTSGVISAITPPFLIPSGFMNLYTSCTGISTTGMYFEVNTGPSYQFMVPQSGQANTQLQLVDFPVVVSSLSANIQLLGSSPNTLSCYIELGFYKAGGGSDSATGMYATSYVNGPPQQWYYPLTATSLSDYQTSQRVYDVRHKYDNLPPPPNG